MELLTIGHGTAGADELTRLLREAGLTAVVDVRTAPGSRHNRDMNRSATAHWLPAADICYRWEERLGGWRRDPPDSPDTALRNRSFGGYAAQMRQPEFADAITALLDGAADVSTTVLCSESVWWRCHRRMIADFVSLARSCTGCAGSPGRPGGR